MTFDQLQRLAEEEIAATRDELPDELRVLAEKLPVVNQLHPSAEILGDMFEPDILGMFIGPPHGQATGEGNDVPAQILLFLGNLWEYAEAEQEVFLDEVHVTYLHELGHYFGWDEDDLAARDLD